MPIMKCVILGDSEAGKTSLLSRWTNGVFPNPEQLRTTIGASFDTKNIKTPNGTDYTLQLWDFGGQERFIEQLQSMVAGCKIGFLVFDMAHMQSLDNLISYWIPMIERNAGFNFQKGDGKRFILVGNKIDLVCNEITEVEGEMKHFAEGYGTDYQMISAKTGVGIEQLDFKTRELVEEFMS